MDGRRWALGLCCIVLPLLALALVPAGASVPTSQPPVLVTRLAGALSPVTANVLIAAADEAEERDAAALLVEVDTPGGLVTSMREVVQRFLNAQVPILTYVTPNGARAASAGTLIVLSGNVAAMAPTTTIGAATPVTIDGGAVGDKIVNDTASYAEAVAEARGRDVGFARRSVVAGESITATEAFELGVIDLVAPNRLTLLAQVDGTSVVLGDGSRETLALAGAPIEELERGFTSSLLERVVDPNLTFVLLALGTLALLIEFANPGIGAGGITGVILLLLAGFSLSLLPTTAVGLLLLLLAAALFIGELFVPGTGVMAAGGSVALVIAGLFLFDDASGLAISQPVLIGVAGAILIASTALAVAARNAQAMPYRLDDEQMLDEVVEVVVANGDQGQAMVNGERWHVRTDEPPLEKGMLVRILDRHGLTLLVEPTDDDWRRR
ncbi:MAG TPA: nodulation protein NfeD [Euzebyales bacterium]|nr:nodulation protein NfeD [Euzebyales bacterium]